MVVKAFISYSFEDQEIMNILLGKLQSQGVKCYVSQHDDNYGGSLPEKLTSAIDANDVVVALLTKNGSESPTVNQEIGYAKNRKKIIPLLGPGVSPPVFLQGMEDGRFTSDTMDQVFNKIAVYVATKMSLEIKSSGKNLKEIVEQEGVSLTTDDGFTRFVLNIGRKYLMKKYGRLDVPLGKDITKFFLIGLGLFVPLFVMIYWTINSHSVDPILLYIGMGLAIPGGLIFSSIEIIRKRKCVECHKNFGIEMTKSIQVEKKEIYRTEDFVKIREIQRNTYTCKFCNHTVTINEPREYKEYFSGHYL